MIDCWDQQRFFIHSLPLNNIMKSLKKECPTFIAEQSGLPAARLPFYDEIKYQ